MSNSIELLVSLQVTDGPNTASSISPSQVQEYQLREGLSSLPELEVVVNVEDGDYLLSDLLRKDVSFGLRRASDAEDASRWFHGIVVAAQELEEVSNVIPYKLTVVPTMWLMEHTKNSRIFQDKTVLAVVEEGWAGAGWS